MNAAFSLGPFSDWSRSRAEYMGFTLAKADIWGKEKPAELLWVL